MKGRIKIPAIDRQMFVKGYTISSLAEKAGVSVLTASGVLLGKKRPTPQTSQLLAAALDMDVIDFRVAIYDAKSA